MRRALIAISVFVVLASTALAANQTRLKELVTI